MAMLLDSSSDCECPHCLETIQNESDGNSYCSKNSNDCFPRRSERKNLTPSFTQCFPAGCGSSRPESDAREEEEECSSDSCQVSHLRLNSEDIARKTRPLRELTIQELLREFGDSKKGQPNSTSLGHFKEQVVMKFRRALYYSGVWVSHVQGHRVEEHFSANYFRRNPGSLDRLVPWLKRELTAVYGDYGYTVKNILTTILQHMTEYDLDSGSFINLLEPYLLEHTHHFIHEFISFVHSPYNIETYDQRAIYQCSAPSAWVKKKPPASAPVLPLPEEQALLVSHHDTRQSNNAHGQWNSEERLPAALKPFPNGNSSVKKCDMPPGHHKSVNKIHVWSKDKPESGDHKGILPTHSTLDWAAPRKERPRLLNCKTRVQARKMPLFPGDVPDLGKSDPIRRTFSTPEIFNQKERERRVLSPKQQMEFQKKDIEKEKYSDSSKNFQRRTPRERSLATCKAGKRNPCLNCISETALSPKREHRKVCSFRKKRMKCKQPSQVVEAGSHVCRTIKRRSRSKTQRSKSCCIGYRKRSISRESSNFSLRRGCRGEHVAQDTCCDFSRGKHAHGYEVAQRRSSSTTVQCVKLCATTSEKPRCSPGEDISHAVSCNSSTYLQIERDSCQSKQKIKHKVTFPRARKNRAIGHRKNKCQCSDKQISGVSSEVWDQEGVRQMSSPEGMSLCRRQIPKKNLNLQKCPVAKNEPKGDTLFEKRR